MIISMIFYNFILFVLIIQQDKINLKFSFNFFKKKIYFLMINYEKRLLFLKFLKHNYFLQNKNYLFVQQSLILFYNKIED